MKNIKNKNVNKAVMIMFCLGLTLLVTGVSYAFFGYYKSGLYTHSFNGGKMNVIYNETTGNNVVISDAYPLTDDEALNEAMEFEFTITGYNESEKNVYYAIEMDHGNEVTGKTRFKDSDMKLSLYENDNLVIENEIFENLDDQGIYFGYIKSGTSSESPMINNYKLRLWVNDNVVVSNTIEDDTTLWDDDDFNWAYNHLTYDQIYEFEEGNAVKLSDVGISVYQTSVFGNLYGSFKINVMANLSGEDIGMIVYDANGGVDTPKTSMLTTNRVTMQKPVMENKVFLGWSTKKDAIVPEYYAGDYYSGPGTTFYAVYSDVRNVMVETFPEEIYNNSYSIMSVQFLNDKQEKIDARYDVASVKVDLTYNNQGSVKMWLENDYYDSEYDEQYYKLYIGSEGTTYLTSGVGLLSGFSNAEEINLANADSSMVEDMSGMFWNNGSLTTLDVSALNTKNVISFSSMFENCNSLKEINVEYFVNDKVQYMASIFSDCYDLKEIDLHNIDTSNVTTMRRMFWNCDGLEKLDISSFDTSNVEDMSGLFGSEIYDHMDSAFSIELKKLDLSHFDTNKVTDMSYMFNGCANLDELNISNFDTSKVTDMEGIFFGLRNVEVIDFEVLDTSNVTNMSYMFASVHFEQDFNLDWLEIDSVTDMSRMFVFSHGKNIYFCDRDFSSVETMEGIFGSINYDNLYFENCILNPNTDLSGFFYSFSLTGNRCKNISLSGTKNLHSINFYGYYQKAEFDNLKSIDLSYCSFSDTTSLNGFIDYCESLEIVDFTGCDFTGVSSLSYMFNYNDAYPNSYNESLKRIVFENVNTSTITDMSYMFYGLTSIEELDLSDFDTSSVTNMSGIFKNTNLITINFDGWNTSKVTNMSEMFYSSNIEMLDLSNFDISQVTNMSGMFFYCTQLTTLDLSNFIVSSSINIGTAYGDGMFAGCSSLQSLDISGFDLSNISLYAYTFRAMSDTVTIYVKDTASQSRILSIHTSYRPANWSTSNIIVKA